MATVPDTPIAVPLEIAEPLRLAHHEPQSEGTCAICGRELGTWLRVRSAGRIRIIRLTQEVMRVAGNDLAVCQPCQIFGQGIAFQDLEEAAHCIKAQWDALQPDAEYTPVARYE